ncbi:MAG: lipoate-protein ligase B [Magnetovibrio sp.]|nr:lipoate-protein ligase B [Magnetovibrio sp.]|tara:strand:+ start:122 stop:790 length:669 start_codon:yes stop_codon:yes gene_type:complete
MLKIHMEWLITYNPVPYQKALAFMEKRVLEIKNGTADEVVWLLEHPPLYTAGSSAKTSDLLDPRRFPVFEAGRGGKYTYHGPGQRVVYIMINLKKRGSDVRRYVHDLEEWIIRSLAKLGVIAERRDKRIGIWVNRKDGREEKIAALGVRVRHWITYHGISINVIPNLSHFDGIIPCGIYNHGVTSLADLGNTSNMADLDKHLLTSFEEIFGITPKESQKLIL